PAPLPALLRPLPERPGVRLTATVREGLSALEDAPSDRLDPIVHLRARPLPHLVDPGVDCSERGDDQHAHLLDAEAEGQDAHVVDRRRRLPRPRVEDQRPDPATAEEVAEAALLVLEARRAAGHEGAAHAPVTTTIAAPTTGAPTKRNTAPR